MAFKTIILTFIYIENAAYCCFMDPQLILLQVIIKLPVNEYIKKFNLIKI
jgi:hypothetical protein